MEITETMTRDQFGEILEKENEVTYSIVQHEDRWAILIENGIFNNFKYVILNMRLRYEDEDEDGNTQTKIVDDINAVIDKELALDFEYDLVSVPSDYEDKEGRQSYFEDVTRNILIDILINYPNLYKLEKDEENK